jgi:uncharacterized protein YccT (UPF0319 family)
VQKRVDLILKQQTKELDATTNKVVIKLKKDFPEANLPTEKIESDSLVAAAETLEDIVSSIK